MRPASMHSRVSAAVEKLVPLIEQLEAELPHKPVTPAGRSSQGGHGPLASWNTPAAMLIMEIHAGVREIEQDVRYMLSGHLRTRGSSHENTLAALNGLPSICAGIDYSQALRVAQKLEKWIWRARLTLGQVEAFSRLPRMPGQPEIPCPYCRASTLRFRPTKGLVRCVNPDCVDGNGRRPAARVEVGDFSQQPILAWADGGTGLVSEA